MATYGEYAPIASDVGHGAPGLRDNLRPFSELVTQSASQKQVFVSVRPARLLTGWSNYSTDGSNSGTYVIPWRETWDGILRDVVGMRTTSETLSRAETLAACAATEGTYYYDADQVVGSYNLWDDGTVWDGGELWDAGLPLLYCHPTDGEDPDDVDTVALCGFYFGSDSVVQPTLGVEKLTNGDLETWSSATNAGTWTEGTYGTGGGAIAQDTGIDGVGTYAAKLSGALNAAGGYGVQQMTSGVAGKLYRASGWYKTDATNPAGIEARLRVGINGGPSPNQYLLSDGSNITTGTAGFALSDTHGYARRFSFDFVCPADTATLELNAFAWNSTGGALTAAGVWFDGLSLKRIWRFERYQSRLALDSVPEVEERRTDAFWGPVARASGTLSLIHDGGMYAVVGGIDWIGAEVTIYSGGRFANGGNEILFDDLFPVFAGIISSRPELDDTRLLLPIEDFRALLDILVPVEKYDTETFPDLEARADGLPRPIFFGAATDIIPARIDKTAATGLPIYEWMNPDVRVAVPGTILITGTAYPDDATRTAAVAGTGVTLASIGSGAGASQADCTLSLTNDIRVIRVEAGKNDSLDFSVAGTPYTGAMPAGLYLWGGANASGNRLPLALQTALNAAGAGAIFNLPTYDLTTGGKATITASSAFAILTGTGNWKGNSFWRDLGFTTQADVAAATSQTSDTGMFTDCDAQIFPRFSIGASYTMLDDASGTYTGSAGGQITSPSSIALFLLREIARVDDAYINLASFVPSGTASVMLGTPGGDQERLSTVIERLETGASVDIVSDVGRFRYIARDTSTSGAIALEESDYLGLSCFYDAEDVFRVVRTGYAQDAVTGEFKTLQTTTPAVRQRFNRQEQHTFKTYFPTSAATTTRHAALVAQATTPPRHFVVRVKGKLFGKPLGQKVQLTRAKGLDSTGALSSVLCRLNARADNSVTMETTAELIEVL